MRMPKFIKSKGFKVYSVIGLFVYIIPFFFGFTNAVRIYLEEKTIFTDYIDEIKQVYINEDKDIAMCVKGNTAGEFNIEYWVFISYSQYEFSEEEFHQNRSTNLSGIDHSLIEKLPCDSGILYKKGYIELEMAIGYLNKLPRDIDPLSTEMFDVNQIENAEDAMIVEQNLNRSQLAFVRKVGDKKIGTLFMMSRIHFESQLNPLWKLLYIPAFILDVLLWPLFLMLFLYSSFFAPLPR